MMVFFEIKRVLGKIYRRILKKRFFPKFFYVKKNKSIAVLMYDNIYPHPVSGFRLEEFTCLLNTFDSNIFINPTSYSVLKTPVIEHKTHIERLLSSPFDVKKEKLITKGIVNVNAKLFYCVFISNIYATITLVEKYKIPFVFTLYPGGGFQINNEYSDAMLQRVMCSPYFKKVIVTQLFVKNYLLEKNFCKESQLEYIFGCVVPQFSMRKDLMTKTYFPETKKVIDICFCAAKYMKHGYDKGYDLFIETAIKLAAQYDYLRFHVIGGFDAMDYDIGLLEDKISFYGYQEFESLAPIFQNMDIIMSPNRPFKLGKGAFDGFPLGAVVEAVFCGVVAVLTDELRQNEIFVHETDLILIEPTIASCYTNMCFLIDNPKKMYEIASSGKEKFYSIYANANQMERRIEILKKELK